jgi:hypothetical protein
VLLRLYPVVELAEVVEEQEEVVEEQEEVVEVEQEEQVVAVWQLARPD